MSDTTQAIEERFWAKVGERPDDPDSCWLWTGAANKDGRGRFGFRGRVELAYRVSYILTIGEVPVGLDVLHDCDNPRCIRPSHLFLGTALDNVADMHAKGRGGRPGAKLTEELVRGIREEWAAERTPQRQIAASRGIHQTTVSEIVNGKTWRGVA